MQLVAAGAGALEPCEREVPIALPGEVLIRVRACGLCRTDLQLLDGALTAVEIPIVPGHEIVGLVEVVGDGVTHLQAGDRVGVPWLGYACGACDYCTSGREHLCRDARFTGLHMDGGFADFVVADGGYVFKLPDGYTDAEAAPLLCAGVTGYRAYRLTGAARRLGLFGDGAAIELVARLAAHEQREVHIVTAAAPPPAVLDAAIVFSTDGRLVTEALARLAPGGCVVCTGVHMSDIPSFPFSDLTADRVIRSVSHHTREDVREFLALAATVPLKARVQAYPLADANRAVADLRDGRIDGAAVLTL
jgi:propanol-preferring alcohol dehydrogenase